MGKKISSDELIRNVNGMVKELECMDKYLKYIMDDINSKLSDLESEESVGGKK